MGFDPEARRGRKNEWHKTSCVSDLLCIFMPVEAAYRHHRWRVSRVSHDINRSPVEHFTQQLSPVMGAYLPGATVSVENWVTGLMKPASTLVRSIYIQAHFKNWLIHFQAQIGGRFRPRPWQDFKI